MVSSPRDAMSVATRMSWWPSWNLSKTPCRLWKSTTDTDILKSRLLHLFTHTHTHTNDNNNNENKNNDGDLEHSICNELNMLKKQTKKQGKDNFPQKLIHVYTDRSQPYRYSTVFIIVVLLEYHYSIIVVRCSIIIVHCSIIVILWYIVISLWYTVVSLEYLVVSIWYSVVSL